MWANSSYRYSILHWLTGWVSNRAYVQWRSIADMPALWNSTETYTLVTTSYSRNINWEISIARHLVEMMHSERQHNFGTMKYQSLPTQCKECDFLFACNGECPKNRFSRTADGEPGLNYLCKGYYQYFQHVAPYMDFMKKELMNQQAPANIMKALKDGSLKIEY